MRHGKLIITIINISRHWLASSLWRMAPLLPELSTPMGHYHSKQIISLGACQSSWGKAVLPIFCHCEPASVPSTYARCCCPLSGSLVVKSSSATGFSGTSLIFNYISAWEYNGEVKKLGSMEAFRPNFAPCPILWPHYLSKDLESNFQLPFLCNRTLATTASPITSHCSLTYTTTHQFSFPPKSILQVRVQRQLHVYKVSGSPQKRSPWPPF